MIEDGTMNGGKGNEVELCVCVGVRVRIGLVIVEGGEGARLVGVKTDLNFEGEGGEGDRRAFEVECTELGFPASPKDELGSREGTGGVGNTRPNGCFAC